MDDSSYQEDLSTAATSITSQGRRASIANRLGTAIFFLLLALVTLVAIPYGTVEPWWQALFECAVFLLTALWLIELFLSGTWRVSAYGILLPLVALVLFGLLQTVPIGAAPSLRAGVRVSQALSMDPHATRRWVTAMLALVLVAAMLLRYTYNPRRLRLVIYLVVWIAVASAAFALLRKMTQHEAGFILPHLMPGLGYGQFINNNHFAFLMEMSLGLVLGLTVAGGVRRDRLPIFLGVILLLGISLVFSNSRGGILSLLCQLIVAALVFLIVHPVKDKSARNDGGITWVQRITRSLLVRAMLVLCLIIAVGLGIIWVGGDPLLSRLEAIPGEVTTREEGPRWSERRVEIWRATWQVIKAHPVAGVGMGGYWVAISKYHDGSGEMTPQRAHNDYLELLASGGLIGAALGAWFVFLLIRSMCRQLRAVDKFRRAAAFGALVGLSGVAVHSIVDFGLHITINALVFILLLVIASADVRYVRKMPTRTAS